MLPRLVLTVLAGLCVQPSHARDDVRLASPDKRIEVRIRVPGSGFGTPEWSAAFRGRTIASGCRLSLRAERLGELLAGARLSSVGRSSADQRVPVLFGRAAHAADRYREARLRFVGRSGSLVSVVFRCYNDGIALRYEVPGKGTDRLTITEEGTSFALTGAPTAYIQILENFRTSHEHPVTAVPYADIPRDKLLDMPATFSWPDGTCAAITEAALRNYAGMSLMRLPSAGKRSELTCRLSPGLGDAKVVRSLPMRTPWRALLVGARPGALLESNTIFCLNEPSIIGDTSWIRPGKITFSWWNGDVFDGKRGAPILSLETQKRYIDWCARSGIPIHSVIADETVTPWYFQSQQGVAPGPDTDVTRVRSDLDLVAIREYARSKGVRLWTWVHHGALRGRVEEAFAAFEKIGWSGMMVDFFDRDDQATVEFTEEILKAAARHRIAIHFHGIYKPTGLERTYPHLMSHEGALNLEYLKWSDRCTPEHNLDMAFTRMIAGQMDYHLGGFRSVSRAAFRPENIAPRVMGTRCHHLAMYVCYDNPNPMVADYPMAYEGQPGFDFLRLVPTYWDETRVLAAEIGKTLVTARRKGKIWYLGGMAARRGSDLSLPLSFLGKGRYTARIWKDAPEPVSDPNGLSVVSRHVTRSDKLSIHIAVDGGFVAQLSPAGVGSD